MKTILLTVSLFLAGTAIAAASCPPGTSYQCYTTYNGKQSCGCR